MTLPFETSSGEIGLKDLDGCAVLAHIGGLYEAMNTKHGAKPVLQTNIVVITGKNAGMEIMDKRIFNSRVVRALRQHVGRAVLGHIALDYSTTNPTVLWMKPTADEGEAAAKWVADNPGRCEDLVAIAESAFRTAQDEQPKRNSTFVPQTQGNDKPNDPPWTNASTEDDEPGY